MKAATNSNNRVKILSPKDSAFWRKAYLEAFVDTTSGHYRQYIGTTRQFSDGAHYLGYLWDCLHQTSRITRITYQRFCREVVRHEELYVFADDHSREKVVGAPLWSYPPYSLISLRPESLLGILPAIPEAIYVFDSSVLWTLILTHEYDDKQRICLGIGIEE